MLLTRAARSTADPRFAIFEKTLDADPRFRVTHDEYLAAAKKQNIDADEADAFLEDLTRRGEVFHFRSGGVNMVYLDARDITSALQQLL